MLLVMLLGMLLVVTLLLVDVLLLILFIITIAIVIFLAHAQSDLLDTTAGNSYASRTIAALIRSSQNQITLVGISVPRFNPSRTML